MMREILFRGKCTQGGNWVKGSLLFHTYPDMVIMVPQGHTSFTVVSETIGQYTGLKDKNGNRIFEGDIISVPYIECRTPYEKNCIYYENGEVYFDTERYGWYVRFSDDEISLWEFDECGVEIIGNIHENPELLSNEVVK